MAIYVSITQRFLKKRRETSKAAKLRQYNVTVGLYANCVSERGVPERSVIKRKIDSLLIGRKSVMPRKSCPVSMLRRRCLSNDGVQVVIVKEKEEKKNVFHFVTITAVNEWC